MTNLPSKRTWHDIGSDVNWIDYGGHWARRIDDTRYHVIRFDNLEECTGEAGVGYHVQLSEVDIDSPQLTSALKCCGFPVERSGNQFFEADHKTPIRPLNAVEALSSYGAYAPLESLSGHNAHSLMRQAKALSRRLESDASAYSEAMDRPVNKLGSTAREYAAGDMLSATLRSLDSGDPDTRVRAEILLKMGVR
jgi:hypothetical protein